jgi:hypothetical protein
MPIEDLIDHPRAIALPIAGRGMVFELCTHFWKSECRSFPMDEDTIRGIVRAHRPTFRSHKAEILAIFADIRPRLEHAWRARQINHATLRAWNANRRANDRKKQAEAGKTSPLVPLTPKHSAIRKSRLTQGDKSFYAAPRQPSPQTKDTDLFRDT